MTRLPANISANGVSPETMKLQSLLRQADTHSSPVLLFDEVRHWPADLIEKLTLWGLLEELGPSDVVTCDSCAENHLIEVDISKYPTGMIGMGKCPECGRIQVPLDRLRQWRLNYLGLAKLVAEAIGTTGSIIEDVPDRIVLVGTVATPIGESEVFLACGLAQKDAQIVLADSARLNASPSPMLLTIGSAPTPGIWLPQSLPRTAVLAEHATLGLNGFEFDLLRAFPGGIMIESKPTEWLRVTDAGKMLLADVSGIDLPQAKARVTKAANESKIRTNGKTGHARRIDPVSYDAWRLEQRNRELAKYD